MTAKRLEPPGKVHTKIVATIGPASREPAMLRALIEAGVDVCRLNFSHGTAEEHAATLRDIRAAADACGRIVAVLQDLCGPKIRLGPIPGDTVDCHLGDTFTLVSDRTSDDPHQFTCTYRELALDLKPGDLVYYADGAVAMAVTESTSDGAVMTVTLAGRIRSNQGLNLPGAALNVKSLTDKDLLDLDWTAEHSVEYVGLSFVRSAADVRLLRAELDRRGRRDAKIVAKIEKPQAVDNLEAIVAEADAVMVARGDLGVELDIARVPAVQKRVIALCNAARVPVITATQMLNSMETSNRPTRAEATDVFNAVLDGTDAVMLSGETAAGQYPVEAVQTMSRIAAEAEALLLAGNGATVGSRQSSVGPVEGHAGWVQPITEGVVEAVRLVAHRLKAALVIVSTHSGRTALALSKQRYGPPTIALSSDPAASRAIALYWGVTPLTATNSADVSRARAVALDWARSRGLVASGDSIVIVCGTMPNHPSHNAILVELVE
jgi:pyruvate kinase